MYFLLALGLAISAAGQPQPLLPVSPLVVESGGKPHRFIVEGADSDAERNAGLMLRTHLDKKSGMLFDYLEARKSVAFWMKDTLIPLDIIFIAPDGRIARIATNATPLSETPILSGGTIRAVLEIRGGSAARLKIKSGDRVRHRIFGDTVK